MNCKYCNAELEEGMRFCPACGKENMEEPEAVEQSSAVDSAPVKKRKLKGWKLWAAVALGVILAAALVTAILYGTGVITFRENGLTYRDSYTFSDKQAIKNADKVVATLNGDELTNGELQVFYWMQIYNFLDYYGTSYFDYTKPLDEQLYSEEKGLTWQHYFLEVALASWERYTTLSFMAEEESFDPGASYQNYLEDLREDLEELAPMYGYESAEEMVQKDMGAACSVDDYIHYLELYNLGTLYFEHAYTEIELTMDEIEAYFTENEESFKKSGITKDSGNLVDVRHVLIQLEDSVKDENGKVQYTDDEWEACQLQAQELYDEWLMGEATEDTFAEMAKKHSVDGSNSVGGLYTEVTEGQMVEAFNDWIFDESRKYGDSGLVRTEFGYHIMFFVGSEAEWIVTARQELTVDRANAQIEDFAKDYTLEIDYKKICLAIHELGE